MSFSEDKGLTEIVRALYERGPDAKKKLTGAADFSMLNQGLKSGSGGRRFRDVSMMVEALRKRGGVPAIWLADISGVVTYFFFGSLDEVVTKLKAVEIAPREIKRPPEMALLKLIARRIKDVKAGIDAALENMRSHPEWMAAAGDDFDRLVDFSQKKLDNVEILKKAIINYSGVVILKDFQKFIEKYDIQPEQFEKAWKYANNEQLPGLK